MVHVYIVHSVHNVVNVWTSIPMLEMTRAREWDSVVTCHAGHRSAYTWNLHNHTIGKHKLRSQHNNARPLVPY